MNDKMTIAVKYESVSDFECVITRRPVLTRLKVASSIQPSPVEL